MFLARYKELTLLEVLFRDRRKHAKLKLLLISLLYFSETSDNNEVHAVEELETLHEYA